MAVVVSALGSLTSTAAASWVYSPRHELPAVEQASSPASQP